MKPAEKNEQLSPLDARTRLRILSVELNNATAELYKARHQALYRRVRALPARHYVPAWGAALIVGGVGAVLGAIPAMLVRGDNVFFVLLAVCAAYTILAPATLLLLADEEGETEDNRLIIREARRKDALACRAECRAHLASLEKQYDEARQALRTRTPTE